ncbi:MAG: hypothetical protein ABFS42_11050 [Candidatus Krumholzibacteriota bacterium]
MIPHCLRPGAAKTDSDPFLLVLTLAAFLLGTVFVCDAFSQDAPTCLGNDENWVFCTGFEEGNLDLWDDYDGNPPETNTLVPHPGPFGREGNTVMRLRAPEGRGGADLVKVLPGTFDRLYARWYVMWEPGYDFNAKGHGSGLFAGDRDLMGNSGYRPDGTNRFLASLEPHATEHRLNFYAYYPGMYQDCVDPEGSCWGDSFPCLDDNGETFCTEPQHRPGPLPPVLETGRWYNVEMLMDGGTPSPDGSVADGILDLWIDGMEYGPWDDLWYRSTSELKLSILYLRLWHHGEHSVEGILLDEVAVSTERIGTATVPAQAGSWGSVKGMYR